MENDNKEMLLRKLGERIRTLRKERGLTQEDFEDYSDISVTSRTIQGIEYGKEDPRFYTLYKIAKQLDVKLSDILDF